MLQQQGQRAVERLYKLRPLVLRAERAHGVVPQRGRGADLQVIGAGEPRRALFEVKDHRHPVMDGFDPDIGRPGHHRAGQKPLPPRGQAREVQRLVVGGRVEEVGLVPLAGYLILFNDEIARFTAFDTLAGITDQAGTTFLIGSVTKLRLVFFGSLLVFGSNVIYRIWHPPVLDESGSATEFASRVRQDYTVREIANIEADVCSEGRRPRLSDFWVFLDSMRKRPVLQGYRPDMRGLLFSKHGDYISFLASEWWVGMMHSNRPARLAALALGIAGYVLLAVPTIDIAQAVVRDMLWSG